MAEVHNAQTPTSQAPAAQQASINDEVATRRQRRQALIDAGINPYPIASCVTAHAAQLEERYATLADGDSATDTYSVSGRIRAIRKQGKVCFIVLEDKTGTIQLFLRINNAVSYTHLTLPTTPYV